MSALATVVGIPLSPENSQAPRISPQSSVYATGCQYLRSLSVVPIVCSATVDSAVWIGTAIDLAVAVAPVAEVAALAFDSCFFVFDGFCYSV